MWLNRRYQLFLHLIQRHLKLVLLTYFNLFLLNIWLFFIFLSTKELSSSSLFTSREIDGRPIKVIYPFQKPQVVVLEDRLVETEEEEEEAEEEIEEVEEVEEVETLEEVVVVIEEVEEDFEQL